MLRERSRDRVASFDILVCNQPSKSLHQFLGRRENFVASKFVLSLKAFFVIVANVTEGLRCSFWVSLNGRDLSFHSMFIGDWGLWTEQLKLAVQRQGRIHCGIRGPIWQIEAEFKSAHPSSHGK